MTVVKHLEKVPAHRDAEAEQQLKAAIDARRTELWAINQQIHSNPELGYEEYKAHDAICSLLESLGFTVARNAYGLETAFCAEYGVGGRVVAYNAEYDALPGIGHACGHNLIATMSIAAFLGVAATMKARGLKEGRVRLIGTPAEEGGGGKLKIIDAGGFADVDASLMVHPGPLSYDEGWDGDAYSPTLANHKLRVRYEGVAAHAAVAPWEGTNALDAAVLAYTGIGVLRQQMHPSSRVHCVIVEGGTRPNIIPSSTTLDCYIRSPTLKAANDLLSKVENCFAGAAQQAGCKVDFDLINTYADVRPNGPISQLYADAMNAMGSRTRCDPSSPGAPASTDQGNVTYECPGFHGGIGIEAPPGCGNHTPGFTASAGEEGAHELSLIAAKGLAITGWQILTDDAVAAAIRADFEADKKRRQNPGVERLVVHRSGYC
ncbi:metal-dependent amidase aminoacylase carboxypeptidase [Ophiostoma piceae UAMH 11346]|uniref:Peptidase M20 domain-containing protein 2 n=1 Tax=Ophiostoma piceae (strain UAMH 11346) TaxID=1262450 RepID=S3BTV0_OPHP1|nr:metal-dependent amidase aminoacylase carboxypeptidase [Ophiostoma piceae UAMH 11346]